MSKCIQILLGPLVAKPSHHMYLSPRTLKKSPKPYIAHHRSFPFLFHYYDYCYYSKNNCYYHYSHIAVVTKLRGKRFKGMPRLGPTVDAGCFHSRVQGTVAA